MIMRSLLLCLCAATVGAPAYGAQLVPEKVAAQPEAGRLDRATQLRIVESALAKMRSAYVFPERVPAIGKVLRSGLAGKYRGLEAQAFTDAVNRDIARVANDKHLSLMWSPEALPPLLDMDHPDPAMVKQQREFMERRNFAIRRAEILDGNIGYLKINGFLPPEEAGDTLSAAMSFLRRSDALIIDLRNNGGGDPAGVAMLISYLVPTDTLINSFHRRDRPVNDQIWSMPYVPGGRWSLDKPVYVLTSADTASGAEEFAYDLQQMKRGTVVGAPTWGGANPGKMEPIDEHFAIFIPFGAAINPISKTNWEGAGVKPDVAVDPSDALTTAQRLAVTKMATSATGERLSELQKILSTQPAR